MPINQDKSVAVVTSTTGRPELERAIQSVLSQTYPCQHYIFVDGEQFEEQTRKIVDKYPNIIVTYLPMNTGANGWTNSSINAVAPFLTKEDILCYLDDDNWYEPNHIKSCIETFSKTDAEYVYALRNLYTPEGQFVCEDLVESIGFYQNKIKYPLKFNVKHNDKLYSWSYETHRTLIDTNCYAMKRKLAITISNSWYSGSGNDFNVFQKLKELNTKNACSKQFTVNYSVDLIKRSNGIDTMMKEMNMQSHNEILELLISMIRLENQENLNMHNGRYPWQIESEMSV